MLEPPISKIIFLLEPAGHGPQVLQPTEDGPVMHPANGEVFQRLIELIIVSAVQNVHLFFGLIACFHTLEGTGDGENGHIDMGQKKGD